MKTRLDLKAQRRKPKGILLTGGTDWRSMQPGCEVLGCARPRSSIGASGQIVTGSTNCAPHHRPLIRQSVANLKTASEAAATSATGDPLLPLS